MMNSVPAYDPLVREREVREYLESVQDVMESAGGVRFMGKLLSECGIGERLACEEGEVALYNFGVDLLKDVMLAAPGQAMNLLAVLFNGDLSGVAAGGGVEGGDGAGGDDIPSGLTGEEVGGFLRGMQE